MDVQGVTAVSASDLELLKWLLAFLTTAVTGVGSLGASEWRAGRARRRKELEDRQKIAEQEVMTRDDTARRLAKIETLLKPNGGTHLPDKVDHLQSGMRVLTAIVKNIDTSAHAIWKWHPTQEVYYCESVSEAFTDLTGQTAAGMQEGGWADCIRDDEVRNYVLARAKEAGVNKMKFREQYWSNHCRTHRETYVRHTADPTIDHTGRITMWFVVLTPIDPPSEDQV